MILTTLVLFSFLNAADASVLYLGDSQSAGYLGRIVYDDLLTRHQADKVDVFGISASSPRHWGSPQNSWNGKWICQRQGRHNTQFEVPLSQKLCSGKRELSTLQNLLAKKNYTHVVFQFLGNSVRLPAEKITKHIKELLSGLGNQKCLFITSPPNFATAGTYSKRMEAQKTFLKAIGKRCQVIEGMTGQVMDRFSKDRSNFLKDRVHLTQQGAKRFFDLKVKGHLP